MSKHKADYVCPPEKGIAAKGYKKPNPSDKPSKKSKHAKPKTTANSKAEARAKFYKGKGLKFVAGN